MSKLRKSRARPVRRRAGARRPRASYHHGDLRAVLLAEVMEIVREQGIESVSLREVARRAKVSHAAPAHHLHNKSGLLTAAAVRGFDLLADSVRDATVEARAETPAEVLEVMGRAYVRYALQHQEHFSLMFRTESVNRDDPEYRRATDRAYLPLQHLVQRAAALSGQAADPTTLAAASWSLVHGLASLWLSGRLQERSGENDPEAMAERVTRVFVQRMLGGTAPPRKR